MKIQKYHIVIIVVTLLSSIGLCALSVKQNKIMVQTVKAERVEKSNESCFSGKLEAFETANIISKVTGKVGSIRVEIGNEVKAGDTLLTLETSELAASVEQARANVEATRSSLETARIDYDVQRQNYERNKVLVEAGALAKADFENKYALPFAKAKELAVNGSQAQLRQAEASLQLALTNYQNSIIVSPISGVISAKNVNIGELASQEVTLFSVVNLDKVFVLTSIGEEKINKIVIGGHVPVEIAAVSTMPFDGTVTNIAQASGLVSKTYLVKVLINNPEHQLKSGMFAEVLWEEKRGVEVVVPKTAIISENGKYYVWTVKNGMASIKEVSVGSIDIINVVINAGIEAGEDVVVAGQETLIDGKPVTAH